jgi:CBS domain-containing protein
MIDVPVSSVMMEDVVLVSPDTSAVEAAAQLRDPDVPALVVCDGSETAIGIVTESDIVAVVAENGNNPPIESFMSRPLVTARPETSVAGAAQRMRNAGVGILPVVEAETPVGLVTRHTISPYLARHHLEITWDGDPLRLATAEAAEASGASADE